MRIRLAQQFRVGATDPGRTFGHAARAGRHGDAEAALASFESRREESYYPAFAFALVYLGLGNHDRALDWPERAADEGLLGYHLPTYDPMWASVRENPRFRGLLARLGLM